MTTSPAPIRILLVEDDPGDVRLTREALAESKLRNELHVVGDGEEAMEFLRRTGRHVDAPRPDVVLLDLNLPRLSGREVLELVKSDPELKSIPVTVLTTSQAEEDIVRSYDLNANAYVTKPVDLAQFMRVVHAVEDFWVQVVRLPPGRR